MKRILRKSSLLVAGSFALLSTSALAQQGTVANKNKKKTTEAYFNHDKIVLEEDDKITKFYTPKQLIEHGRFSVRIKRPKVGRDEGEAYVPTMAEKVEARRLMHDANQAYFKGEISKAWELVEKAEDLDPDFYRIKTMKGSLLYKIGSADLAKEIWMKSLEQNPNQPEIIKVIDQMNRGAKPTAPIATQKGVPSNKKGVLR